MAQLFERVRHTGLLNRLARPADLLSHFKNGQYLGWSGFTGVGYPKMVPTMLADHVEANQLQGKMKFNLFVGASSGPETDDRWANLNMVDRRYPHQVGKNLQRGINNGQIRFSDKHLGEFPLDLLYGYYTFREKPGPRPIDIGMIEATAILEDGSIVPGASVGCTYEIVQLSEKLIIEVNTALPNYLGVHDIYSQAHHPPSNPIPITKVDDRVGSTSIKIDPSRVIAIVESKVPDRTGENSESDEVSDAIAGHIQDFLLAEVKSGRLPANLLPLQSGIGNIANAIIGGLAKGPFRDVTVWTEVIQDTFLDFFEQDKLKFASATSLRLSPAGFDRLYKRWDYYKQRLVLRPQQLSNSPELIRRLGIIAMNTPVEFDLYGHANSTLVNGTRMINGIGGSNDFLRNGKLSIMHAPSVRPSKTDPLGISSVVPFCSHVDQTEHDVDIFVTEQGVADLRGLSPKERAPVVIENCAHPAYRPLLREYFKRSSEICLRNISGHQPHMLDRAFRMHNHLAMHGTMRIPSWD